MFNENFSNSKKLESMFINYERPSSITVITSLAASNRIHHEVYWNYNSGIFKNSLY